MPQAPAHPTASRFFSTPQPTQDIIPKPRKRIPLALLELNGVKINSYRTVDTPPKKAWVKVTPERITLESPPVLFGSSIPLPTRTPSGSVRKPAPGKGNRPPPGSGERWASPKSLKKGPVLGYEIEESDVVSDGEFEHESEEFGFGLVCRLGGKIYCEDEHEGEATTEIASKPAGPLLTSSRNPSMITDVEYLRKEHSTPLGNKEVLARNNTLTMAPPTPPSPLAFENTLCSHFSKVIGPAGHDGVPSDRPCPFPELETMSDSGIPPLSNRESSISEAISSDAAPSSNDLVSQKCQLRTHDNIPIYKLISPTGICLPLHSTPRPARISSQHKPSKIPSSVESSRDIVCFKHITTSVESPIPAVEVVSKQTSAPPESRIPVPTLQRKLLPLPRTRAGRIVGNFGSKGLSGVNVRAAADQELPPSMVNSDLGGAVLHRLASKDVVEQNVTVDGSTSKDTPSLPRINSAVTSESSHHHSMSQTPSVSSITVRKPLSPDYFDPYLENYSQSSNLPPLY